MTAPTSFDPQVLGGWLLLADMVLAAILFAFWERAGRVRLGRRQGSGR